MQAPTVHPTALKPGPQAIPLEGLGAASARQASTCGRFIRALRCFLGTLLGGSWAVISRVISPLIAIVTLLTTPLITTHEPPSRPQEGSGA